MYAMTLVPPQADEDSINPASFDFDRMIDDPDFGGALDAQISVQANNKELQVGQLAAARDVLEVLRSHQEVP